MRKGDVVVWGRYESTGPQAVFDYLVADESYVFEVRACLPAGCSTWKGVAAVPDGPGC